jgi:hypothetical protein
MSKTSAVLLWLAVIAWAVTLRPVADAVPFWASALIGVGVVGGVFATWRLFLATSEEVGS